MENQLACYTLNDVAARKIKGTRGGWRPGAGRPATLKDPVSFTGEFERAEIEFLETIASDRGVSIASLVRQAVAAYVKRQKKR